MSPTSLKPEITPTTPPTFVPRSLYIGLLRLPSKQASPRSQSIHANPSSASSGTTSAETPPRRLALFYTEFLNLRSLDFKPAEGEYWYLTESEPGVFTPIKGSMRVEKALHMEQAVGYVRIASAIPRSQAMRTLIEKGDHRVNSTEGMCSELYVYQAVERLRQWGIVRGYFFDFETFKQEIDRLWDEWIRDERGGEKPRPLTDFSYCELW